MSIQKAFLAKKLEFFNELHLISPDEISSILKILDSDFAYRTITETADSLHIHIRIEEVASLPHEQIRQNGGISENERDGYIKYQHPEGIHFIFSSIPVAEEDLMEGPHKARPHVDHIGFDLRQENSANQALFEAVPEMAKQHHWGYAHQGGSGQAVFCCHTQVSEKHWVYPTKDNGMILEFAYGPLKIEKGRSGCDLRPADPKRLLNTSTLACQQPARSACSQEKSL